jgi:hypothetical protein
MHSSSIYLWGKRYVLIICTLPRRDKEKRVHFSLYIYNAHNQSQPMLGQTQINTN